MISEDYKKNDNTTAEPLEEEKRLWNGTQDDYHQFYKNGKRTRFHPCKRQGYKDDCSNCPHHDTTRYEGCLR